MYRVISHAVSPLSTTPSCKRRDNRQELPRFLESPRVSVTCPTPTSLGGLVLCLDLLASHRTLLLGASKPQKQHFPGPLRNLAFSFPFLFPSDFRFCPFLFLQRAVRLPISVFFGALLARMRYSFFPFWFYGDFFSDVRLQRKPPTIKITTRLTL